MHRLHGIGRTTEKSYAIDTEFLAFGVDTEVVFISTWMNDHGDMGLWNVSINRGEARTDWNSSTVGCIEFLRSHGSFVVMQGPKSEGGFDYELLDDTDAQLEGVSRHVEPIIWPNWGFEELMLAAWGDAYVTRPDHPVFSIP